MNLINIFLRFHSYYSYALWVLTAATLPGFQYLCLIKCWFEEKGQNCYLIKWKHFSMAQCYNHALACLCNWILKELQFDFNCKFLKLCRDLEGRWQKKPMILIYLQEWILFIITVHSYNEFLWLSGCSWEFQLWVWTKFFPIRDHLNKVFSHKRSVMQYHTLPLLGLLINKLLTKVDLKPKEAVILCKDLCWKCVNFTGDHSLELKSKSTNQKFHQ